MSKRSWIKVSEQLPKNYQAVWFYVRGVGVCAGHFEADSLGDPAFWIGHDWSYGIDPEDEAPATHWMPYDAPEPPTDSEATNARAECWSC